ncbi:hypothetical protein RU89_GL002404 [Lactococcus cremoris]|nr:hypothetical protein AB995_1724 [Lactococcus cremoris]KZK39967.1 hypothetical protein LMG6897_1512 [Lactococcus cremoris]KZK45641.1 hypothetical protein FG2_1660 [Lactococcus cremoris]PCS12193.1 hypothetical protein RU89_GL002404 [Lactococcus cremoris]
MKQIQPYFSEIFAFAFYFIIQIYQQKQGLRGQFQAISILFLPILSLSN